MSASVHKHPPDRDPKARFRSAQRRPDFTIDQNWSAYSPAEHDRWDRLFKRSYATLRHRACGEFLAMMQKLELSRSGIPDMEKLSSRLIKLTGWRVVPVLQLVPDAVFFDHLANRRFPAGAFIRSETFTTCLATFLYWPIPSMPILCRPTVKAAIERFPVADLPIWHVSTGIRSNSA